MAPSSLRKMGGRGGRVEGNYASTNSSQSMGSSLNNDLGLTLFPGSQTKSVGERRGHTNVNEDGDPGRAITGDEPYGEPSGYGKPQGSNARTTATGYGEGDVEANDAEWNDLGSHLSENFMKHKNRRQCRPEDPDSSRRLPVTARKPKGVNSNAPGKDQDHPTEEAPPARKDPLSIGNGLVESQQSMPQGREYSRRSASASNLKNSRIFAEESYNNASLKQRPTSTAERQVIDISGESHDAPLDTEGFYEGSVVLAPSNLKSLAEIERSESQRSVIPIQSSPASRNLPSNPTAPSSTFNISSSPCQPSSRPRVLVSRSWTSHFPKASKNLQAKRYANRPAPSSAATSSLIPHHHHHHGQQIQDTPSVNSDQLRQNSTPLINQVPSFSDNISSPIKEFALQLIDCAPAIPSGSIPTKHLRHSTHRRTKSLPNLISTQQQRIMESTYNGGSSSLPTPPREAQLSSSVPPSWSVNFVPDQISANHMYMSNKVFSASKSSRSTSASTHPVAHGLHGHPSMLSSQSASAANMGRPSSHFQYQYPSNFSNIVQIPNSQTTHSRGPSTPRSLQPFSEAVHSNGSGTPVLQQPNGPAAHEGTALTHSQWQNNNQTMPVSRPYSGPGTKALNNGPVTSQSSVRSNPESKNIHSHPGFQSPMVPFEANNNTLRQQLEESLRQQDQLRGSLQWHERGEAFLLNSQLLCWRDQMLERITFLERENQQLKSNNALLLSEMHNLAGRPMTDERTAHNILQSYRHNTDRPNGIHNQRAINGPTRHLPTAFSNPSSGPGSSWQAAGLMYASDNSANTLAEPITIDLTDGRSQSSNARDNFTSVRQGTRPQVHEPDVNGTVTGQFHQDHPVNLDQDTHVAGSSGSESPNHLPKRSPKKTKDIIRVAESLSPAQREQIQNNVLASKKAVKPAKQAQYSKKSNQKKAKEAFDHASREASQASPSTQRKEKQPRKSAKAQKRVEQTRKPLAQVQRQVTQQAVDEASQEKGTNDNVRASSHTEEPTNAMEVDSLFADDGEQGFAGMKEGDFDTAKFAAQIEAEMTAHAGPETESQTEAEADTNQGSTAQDQVETQNSEENVRADISDGEFIAMLQAANAEQVFEENQGDFEWAVSPGHELVDFSEIQEQWRSGL